VAVGGGGAAAAMGSVRVPCTFAPCKPTSDTLRLAYHVVCAIGVLELVWAQLRARPKHQDAAILVPADAKQLRATVWLSSRARVDQATRHGGLAGCRRCCWRSRLRQRSPARRPAARAPACCAGARGGRRRRPAGSSTRPSTSWSRSTGQYCRTWASRAARATRQPTPSRRARHALRPVLNSLHLPAMVIYWPFMSLRASMPRCQSPTL